MLGWNDVGWLPGTGISCSTIYVTCERGTLPVSRMRDYMHMNRCAVILQVEVKKAVTKSELKPKPATTNELACVPRQTYTPLYQQGL